ncbi:hybrid sensor histidine kinase/response regulator [Ramlibacter sp. PS4R-6]|uniref:hybrid sensor histidine kinase/response regulator n=1 Tax=Ramlibacter sp. PS4R-6 TaxID=3133438 RepID=UPI0030954627
MSPVSRGTTGPLRMRLLLLAASGLVPLVMVLAWGVSHLYDEQRNSAQRSALEISRALATAVEAEVRSITALLDQMSTSDELERADLRAFHLSTRRSAQQLGWRQVVLADAEGHLLFRSNQPFDRFDPQPVDPDSLNEVVRTKKPLVSRVVVSPSDKVETFVVRVPVVRGEHVVYILSAVLSTEVIHKVLARQNIPVGSVASVFDQTGRRMARSRPPVSAPPNPSLTRLLAGGATQGVGMTTTTEGEQVYTGFTRLHSFGWVVSVGTSVNEANRSFYALLGAIALGLGASLALALVLAWVLARRVSEPIERLKEAASALGRGAPVHVPTLEISELDDVAVALRTAAMERDLATQERVEALRIAEDANRSKDQFLAMLGHELRNPLAPIANAVQLMALKGDEATAQERRIIERQLVHVTRLVDDLLDVSRITTGRLTLARRPVNVAHILEQVVDAIQPLLMKRTLLLELDPEVHGAWIEGDEVRLVQVFNNLLVNAVKFTPSGGEIHVRAHVAGEDVRVEVRDDGIGMASDELKRVFELFYQAPQNTDRSRGGLGLGLPIVRSLVQMHGGSVKATSEGPGRGACIEVTLPLASPPEQAAPSAPMALEKGSGRVMVVDDNEDAADTCATLLEMSGYAVKVAYTPDAALKLLEEWTPDVAILDIGLPGMSGYELAREFRQRNYGGRLAALTGYGQAADMAASKVAGFDAHLTKPVSPQELLELVAKLSEGAPA